MAKFSKDIKGQQFGRLLAIVPTDKRTKSRGIIWLCRCLCGNLMETDTHNLLRGDTKSCGCLRRDGTKWRFFKTGESTERLYHIWRNMNGRCYNTNNHAYHRYGNRGIQVCDEWKNDYFMFKKWALESGYGDDLTIDKINNDGEYTPSNCQWITKSENAQKWHQQDKINEQYGGDRPLVYNRRVSN